MISPGFNNLSSLPQKDSLHLEGSNQDALLAMGQAPLGFLALLPRPPVQLLLWKGHLRTLHTTIFTHYIKQMVPNVWCSSLTNFRQSLVCLLVSIPSLS